MQNKRECIARCLRVALIVAGVSVVAGASAQSQTAEVPDHAALIGVPMTAKQAQEARTRRTTALDVQRRAQAAGIVRTPEQRRASEGINRELNKMPETQELALRQSFKGPSGATITLTSRQELQPMYAVPTGDGGINASHEVTDDTAR
ncbi:hypothetical protein [Stenotrophomonas humi]